MADLITLAHRLNAGLQLSAEASHLQGMAAAYAGCHVSITVVRRGFSDQRLVWHLSRAEAQQLADQLATAIVASIVD